MRTPVEIGTTSDGATVHAVTLSSDALTATVLTLGATLNRLVWHTADGDVDVVLGFADLGGRLADPDPYLGAVVGPFANRIAGARMTIDGVEHCLTANDRSSCLHGGSAGTDQAIWQPAEHDDRRLVLTHRVEDGEGGFPGPIDMTATYTLADDTLTLELAATTERATPVSLTSHAYLTLTGGGVTDDHELRVPASQVLEVDELGIPVAARDVADLGLDLRTATRVGDLRRRDVEQVRLLGGVDHPYLVDGEGMRVVAELTHPATGRRVELSSDQPGLQVYTGHMLTTSAPGHDGGLMHHGDGIALEPQGYPDSPNQDWMPSEILRPGERFTSTMSWRFTQA